MIVLDTNVISETSKAQPNERVVQWVNSQTADVALTAITVGELWAGVHLMSVGRRRNLVEGWLKRNVLTGYGAQILPFSLETARHYGAIRATRSRSGRPIDELDAQIAAICRQYGATLATRNVKDFADTGIDVVDPWSA